MRNLARILSVPVALVVVSLGAFALLASYGTQTELAEQTRRQLQVANRWVIERGVGVPRDLSVTMEEIVEGRGLPFVLLAGGLVWLGFGIGIIGRARVVEGSDEKLDSHAKRSAKGHKKASRKIIRQANALKKKGEPLEAADLLWNNELLDESAALFIESGEFARAAEIRHDQNRFIESAELHLQANNYEAAGSIFGQQEEWGQAAECYLKCGHQSVAGEMFEKAGKHKQAALCYQQSELLRHAAAMFVKSQRWQQAAECLEQVFVEEGASAGLDSKKAADMDKLVRQAGKLFLKAEEPGRALDMFARGGCDLEAGEVASRLGDHEAAASHFRSAGEVERAAESLRQSGQGPAASRLLGQHLRDSGDSQRAAQLLEEAGDHMEAGDLYRFLEQFEKAGECYEEQDSFAQAAEMFQLSGDRERAGNAFERAGRFTEGAECYALAGNSLREAELLDRAGDFFRSGETYHREGLDEEAISVLQKVPQEDDDFGCAAAILGDIFVKRGQLSLAITKLRQAISDTELTRASIDSFFRLATLYQDDGKLREAVTIYEKVMAFDYHYNDVEERLANARALVEEEELMAGVSAGGAESNSSANRAGRAAAGDRYQIVGELGRGGMGIVYKANDTMLDRIVAFKVLPQAFTENQQAINNFMREAQAAAKLNHPNIVTVYDTGEQQGHYYIAMEYVEGTTLKEILRRRGAISPSGILHVLMQISEALAYAHEKKVVHRDVKPANAMWTRDKKAKLMDFGLAKVVEEARNHTTVIAGTPYYMSPEQTLGKNVDHRTDIYSLGAAVFEMATGTVPFKEGNIPYHHVHTPAPSILDLRPELPTALAAIVDRCLQKDPGDRYQSAREILTEVRNWLANTGEADRRPK